mgnify:CR=1 FL=1
MSKIEKLLTKFLNEPPPKDFKWAQLKTLMGSLGYELIPGKGSHFAFFNKETNHYVRGIPKPHPGNELKACYIRLIKQGLLETGAIKNE